MIPAIAPPALVEGSPFTNAQQEPKQEPKKAPQIVGSASSGSGSSQASTPYISDVSTSNRSSKTSGRSSELWKHTRRHSTQSRRTGSSAQEHPRKPALKYYSRQGKRRLLSRAQSIFCRSCTSLTAALLVVAGSILILVGIVDLLVLSSVAQGVCVLSGFEYPDGYPDQDVGGNKTFSLHPCPLTPNCLFQVDMKLDYRLRRVRFFNPPFDIPSHATPGEAYSEQPLPGGLSCCPFTPRDCCSWYNSARRHFCDAKLGAPCEASGAPWPCFLRELGPPTASSDHFLEQSQLDGSMLEVGSKWRSLPLLLEGCLLALAGLSLRACQRPDVRPRIDGLAEYLLRGCERRVNTLLLGFVKLLPKFLRSERVQSLLIQDAAAVPLQRAARRWLARRAGKRSMADAVELAMQRRTPTPTRPC